LLQVLNPLQSRASKVENSSPALRTELPDNQRQHFRTRPSYNPWQEACMPRMPLVFRPNPTLSMALAGIVVTLSACGSDASSSNTPMPTDTVTAPASTTAAPDLQPSTPPATTAPPTVPSVTPPATSEV